MYVYLVFGYFENDIYFMIQQPGYLSYDSRARCVWFTLRLLFLSFHQLNWNCVTITYTGWITNDFLSCNKRIFTLFNTIVNTSIKIPSSNKNMIIRRRHASQHKPFFNWTSKRSSKLWKSLSLNSSYSASWAE